MPTDYNPDEFARAKHLVALAEQINTKINTVSARTSRPVSLAYKKSDNTYAQLDSAASALSIPFENLTAVLRIASGDEDIVPTITLSNNVTAGTPTYSNGYFETTLTLPGASVTSFSMTIALPQTETFSAWQKTYNVDTASDKTNRSLTLTFGDGGAHPVDLSSNVINTTIVDAFRADNTRIPFFLVSNTDTSVKETAVLTISDISTTGSSISLFQSTITIRPTQNDFRWEFLMGAREAQTIQFTLAFIGTDTFQPWSQSFTMIIGGE